MFRVIKKIILSYDKILSKDPMRASGDIVSHDMSVTKKRPIYVAGFFIVLYLITIIRVYDLSMPDFFQNQQNSSVTKINSVKNSKMRASIVDRHGVIMATQLKVSHLIADPYKIINPTEVAFNIQSIFPDIDMDKLIKYLSNKKSRYYIIKRNVTPAEQQALHDMGIPGIDFETAETRFYPQENMASHVIGLTDTDMHGVAGVERYFEKYLMQPNKENLQLSIDLRVQYILKTALEKSIKTFDAIGGSALVMDIKTGEILGMVSAPDFNPNNRATMTDITKFNRASVGVYEPGSVFKIINTAIALETKTSKISSFYDVSRSPSVGRYPIRDYHPYNGSLSVADIM